MVLAPRPHTENAYRGTDASGRHGADDVVGGVAQHHPSRKGHVMKVLGRCVAAIVAVLTTLPAAASAAAPQKNSGKLPSSACKLLTLAQVQKVLPGRHGRAAGPRQGRQGGDLRLETST